MSNERSGGKRKMQNNPTKKDEDVKNKRNPDADDAQFRNQAGQSNVTHESAGGQYQTKQDKLGKIKDRNEDEGDKAPDLSEPNVEGGAGGSVYDAGNTVKGKDKDPDNK